MTYDGQNTMAAVAQCNDLVVSEIATANMAILMELPFYPPSARVPLQQTMKDKEDLMCLIQRAKKEYPSLPEADFALETYAQEYKKEGIFFPGDDGERKMWGPDCHCYHKKDYKGYYFEIHSPDGADNRTFFFHPRKRSLKQIDQQILDLIIRFAVYVERPVSLRPMTVTCNWRRLWSQPHYRLVHGTASDRWFGRPQTKRYDPDEVNLVITVKHRDREGSYTEYRNAFRTAIDASCLRTCKVFNQFGNQMLYGFNRFHFNMTCIDWNGCPPSYLHRKDLEQWRPSPYQPQIGGAWLSKVNSAIGKVKHQVGLKPLPGWVAYDAFLRFLWTIGPQKAALLKSLTFQGLVKIHRCELAYCQNCRVTGLLDSLRIYIRFILKLCPSIGTLTLYAFEDTEFVSNPQVLPAGHPLSRDEALIQLLENEIRQIRGLKELNVLEETQPGRSTVL
ncbi:hypothetical protein BKA65DRAFT_570248 [Rhexocercosporidium sp. MPI-PUGE-AT-0058]|nr:hypothetical protein BKA65DRAFT_570248 [Rhexocercosporidium sp. MPI-PUGE-AT-0058]